MKHEKIYTDKAPAPGPYSQGRKVDLGNGYLVYTCGQTGDDPKTGEVVEGGIVEQSIQALENIKAIVEEAGGTLEDVVKVNVSMKNMSLNKKIFEQVYKKYFPKDKIQPARALVEVSEIPLPGDPAKIEIEAIAYIAKKQFQPRWGGDDSK